MPPSGSTGSYVSVDYRIRHLAIFLLGITPLSKMVEKEWKILGA